MISKDILDTLARSEQTIDGIASATAGFPIAVPNLPAIINVPSGGEFGVSFGKRATSTDKDIVDLIVVVSSGDVAKAQIHVLWLIQAIRDWFDDNPTINGSVISADLKGYRDWGFQSVGGNAYFGVKLQLEILT